MRNIDRNLRLCSKCNMQFIENEYHFVLVCPFYGELRKQKLPKYYCHWPSVYKFMSLMSTTSQSLINKLANYVYHANIIRG